MAEESTPLDRLVDLAVYAPVGLALELRKQLPGWAKTGRAEVDNRVKLYRMIGKFAVQQGRVELVKRLDQLAADRAAASAGIIDAASERVEDGSGSSTTAPASTSATVAGAPRRSTSTDEPRPVGRAAAGATKLRATKAPASAPTTIADSGAEPTVLPIADYDSLAASQVVTRLGALSPAELVAVFDYETSHRGRRTVLGKVAQLQAG
jgi:hypothetical protein